MPSLNDSLAPLEPKVMGAISMVSGSHNTYPCDRIALSRNGEIHLLCVVGNSMSMKSLFAFLNTNSKGYLEIPNKTMDMLPFTTSSGSSTSPSKLSKTMGGYRIYRDKLNYGLWHCGIVSKATNFITSISDMALWQQLNQPWYTTPIVQEWIPYVRRSLISEGKLMETFGFQTRCGLIALTNDELDEIIVCGIKSGEIRIPGGG